MLGSKKYLFAGKKSLAATESDYYKARMFRRSSAVEQLTVNQLVVGSIPTAGANTPLKVLETLRS
jgi:hypothetical protein